MDVGFIGLGAMGSRMAARLADAGHAVTAWNRSDVEPPQGVTLARDPAAVAAAAPQTFVIVGGPSDVDDVVFGEAGWAEGAAPRSLLIQSTTIGPSATRSLAGHLGERGLRMIDAPVGGTTGAAAAGQLVIMAGGDADDIARVQQLFDVVGSKTVHFGGIGTGSAVKLMVNTVLIASLASAAEVWAWLSETEAELDVERVAGALERISPVVARRMPDIAGDPVPPGFAIRHARKDIALVVDEARQGTVVQAALQALADAESLGLADADMAALGESARRQRL